MPSITQSDNSLDKATSRFFRVLGDPTRIKIIDLLCTSPKSVGEIVEYVGISQARVSSHLACLRWCGFVETEKVGRQVIYSIVDDTIKDLLVLARQMTLPREEHLASCTRIGPDWA